MAGLALRSGLSSGSALRWRHQLAMRSVPHERFCRLQPNLFIMTSSGERLDQSLPPFHRPSLPGSAQKKKKNPAVIQPDKPFIFSENCVSTLFVSLDLIGVSVWFRLYLRGITYQRRAVDFYQCFPALYRINLGSNDLFFSLCLAMFHSSLLRKISFSLCSAV